MNTNIFSLVLRSSLALSFIFISTNYSIDTIYAAPRSTPFAIGETLDPGCAPTDLNCFPSVTQLRPVGTSTGLTGLMQWLELATNGTNTIGFRAPDSISANVLWTLPGADGIASQVLQTDGVGNLNWITVSSSSTVISLLNGLNASTQTFATGTDTNMKLTVVSSGSTHTFTPTWVGVLSVSRGGTGISIYNKGDLLVGSASGTLNTIATGTTNQVLTMISGVPTWSAVPAAGSLASGTLTNSTLYWNGTAWVENTSFLANVGSSTVGGNFNVTGTSTLATTTLTAATSTSFFSSLLSGITAFFTNLTTTNATATNLVVTNASSTNATTTNLVLNNALGIRYGGTGTSTAPTTGQILVGNATGGYDYVATSTLFVASSTFASSTTIGANVAGAAATGIFFLSATGTLVQDTANFNYDSVTKKLTVTGGIDPQYFQAKDVLTPGLNQAYFEAYSGDGTAISAASSGRLRYSTTTQSWQLSANGGVYRDIAVNGGSLTWLNATGTQLVMLGTSTLATTTLTAATSTSFFSSLLSSITGFIANFTTTNATATNLAITSKLFDSTGATGTLGQVLTSTGTSTKWNFVASGGSLASGTATNTTIYWNGSNWVENTAFNIDASGNSTTSGRSIVYGTSTLATTSATALTVSGISALATTSVSQFSAATGTITELNNVNATSTNFFANILRAATLYISSLFFDNATGSNLVVGNITATNTLSVIGTSTLATTTMTAATSSSLFSTLISGVTAFFTNLTVTNATTTGVLATLGGVNATGNGYNAREVISASGTVASVQFDITNNGSSDFAYDYNLDGIADANDPTLTLVRGLTYKFNINTPGHNFFIKDAPVTGTGNQYNGGVTNNGTSGGIITFTVPMSAPSTLYYNCQFHAAMSGRIQIVDNSSLLDANGVARAIASTTGLLVNNDMYVTGTSTLATTSVSQFSAATGTITELNNVNATSTNFFANILRAATLYISSLFFDNATGSNLVVGNITATNTLSVIGTSTLATTTISNLSVSTGTITELNNVNATSSNLYSGILRAVSAYFTNLTTTNATSTSLVSGTSTVTNQFLVTGTSTLATTTVSNVTISQYIALNGALRDSAGATGTLGQVLSSTATSTKWINVASSGALASGTATNTTLYWNGNNWTENTSFFTGIGTTTANGYFTVLGTTTLATTTMTAATSTSFFASMFSAVTAYLTNLNVSGTTTLATTTATQLATNYGVGIASNTPATTTNWLYNLAGNLFFNGTQLGSSATTFQNVSASTTLIAYGKTVLVDDTTGNIVLTLPTPIGNAGQSIEIKKVSTTTNSIMIIGNASTTQTIDGAFNYFLTKNADAVTIRSDGTNYKIVSDKGASNVLAEYGQVILTSDQSGLSNTTFANTPTISSMILPSAGTYRISYNAVGQVGTINSNIGFRLFNTTANSSISETERYQNINTGLSASFTNVETVITVTSPTVINLQSKISAGTYTVAGQAAIGSGGQTSMSFQKISGNSAITGSSVDYASFQLTNGQSLTSVATITYASTFSGNIPVNLATGLITLTAGKTYEMEAGLSGALSVSGSVDTSWVDATGTQLPGSTKGTLASATVLNPNHIAKAVITPTVNMQVAVKIVSPALTGAVDNVTSFVRINQLGSSATTEYETISLGNFPTGGAILTGTLSSYVNHINVNQTTPSQTLSLPNPTNQNLQRIVYINSRGNSGFTLHGFSLGSNDSAAFIWNGAAWRPFSSSVAVQAGYMQAKLSTTQSANITAGTDFVKFDTILASYGGDITLDTATAYSSAQNVASVGRFTLKAGKTYKLSGSTICGSTGCYVGSQWYNTDANLPVGTSAISSDPQASGLGVSNSPSAISFFTPTSDTRVALKIVTGASVTGIYSNTPFGETTASIEVIGGQAAITGSSVDYVYATIANSSYTANTAFNFTTATGNISNSAGTFTLAAGKTYRLQAQLNSSNIGGSAIRYRWYNVTTASYVGIDGVSYAPTNSGNEGNLGQAEYTFTPSVTTQIQVSNSSSYTNVSGSVNITQLGASAVTSESIVAVGGNSGAFANSLLRIGTIANNAFAFIASSTEALRILVTGQVDVGTSTAQSASLFVQGNLLHNNIFELASTTGLSLLSVGQGGGLTIASSTPSATSSTMYNLGGTLYWNGLALALGSTTNSIAYATSTGILTSIVGGTVATSSFATLATTSIQNLTVVGTSTLATTTMTAATSTSFYATLLSSLTSFFTNLSATNATTTSLVAGTSTVTNLFTVTGTSTLATTSATRFSATDITLGSTTNTGLFTVNGTSTLATTTMTAATSTSFYATLLSSLTSFFTNLSATNATATSLVAGTSTVTNLFAVTGTSTLATTSATRFSATDITLGSTTNTGLFTVNGTSTLATTTATGLTLTQNGLTLASSAPATTSSTLYNNAGTLYFNGTAVGSGASPFTLSGSSIVNSSSTAALIFGNQLAISTTTNALYNQAGTLYWNGNQLASGVSSLNAIFDENFAAGTAVRLYNNGSQMRIGSLFSAGSGNSGEVSTFSANTTDATNAGGASSAVQTVWINDTTVLQSWRNAGNTGKNLRAATISGTTATYGATLSSAVSAGEDNGVIEMPLSNNKAVFLTNTSTHFIASVSGTTVSVGTANGLSGLSYGSPTIQGVETAVDEVLVVGSSDASNLEYVVADISGNNFSTVGSKATIDTTSSGLLSYTDSDVAKINSSNASTTVVISYQKSANNAQVKACTVNSALNTITCGTAVSISATVTDGSSRIIGYAQNKAAVLYKNSANSSRLTVQLIDISGTAVTLNGTAQQVSADVVTADVNAYSLDIKSPSTNTLLITSNNSANTPIKVYPATVSGSAITLGTSQQVDTSSQLNFSNSIMSTPPTGGKFALGYLNNSTNYFPRLVIGLMGDSATDNRSLYSGVVSSSSVANATGTIALWGNVLSNTISNLVSGATYYINTLGQLTTTNTGFIAGKALSTTQLDLNQGIQGSGNVQSTANVVASYMKVGMITYQTPIAAGDFVKFTTINNQYGSDISYNSGTYEFTLKAGKTYRLTGSIPVAYSTNAGLLTYAWRDNTAGTDFTNEGGSLYGTANANNSNGSAPAFKIVTPSVDTKYVLKLTQVTGFTYLGDGAVSGSFFPTALVEVIAGNAAVTGQSVDYLSAVPVAGGYSGTTTISMTTLSGNIPNASGVFSLTAGKTYQIDAYVQGTNGAWSLRLLDASSNILKMGSTLVEDVGSNQGQYLSHVYTPSANITVRLVQGITGSENISGTNGYVKITQLGTTATTEYTNNILPNFTTGGAIFTGTISEYINHVQILQTTTGQTLTIPSPTNASSSRIVFIDNTGTANFQMHGVTVGAGETNAFKWNGTTWKSFGNQAANVAAEYGQLVGFGANSTNINPSGSGTIIDVPSSTFTIPTAGTWEVSYDLPLETNSGTTNLINVIAATTDGNNTELTNSRVSATSNTSGSGVTPQMYSRTFNVTTSGPTNYKLRSFTPGVVSIFSGSNYVTVAKISWKKIGGYIAVIGQMVDNLHVSKTGTSWVGGFQTMNAVSGDTNINNVTSMSAVDLTSPQISSNSGAFTLTSTGLTALKAGRYNIDFSLSLTTSAIANQPAAFATKNGNYSVKYGTITNGAGGTAGRSNMLASAFTIDLVVGDTIEIRAGEMNNSTATTLNTYSINVKQVGTSAFTSDSILAVGGNQFSSTGSYLNIGTLNNNGLQFIASSTVVGGFSYSSTTNTSTLFVGTSSPSVSALQNVNLYIQGIAKLGLNNGIGSALIIDQATSTVATTTNALYAINGSLYYNGAQIYYGSSSTPNQVVASYMYTERSSDQISVVAGTDHVGYNSITNQFGSDITVDTVSAYGIAANTAALGRITLKAGKTYRLKGSTAGSNAWAQYAYFCWYNADTNVQIGTSSMCGASEGPGLASGGSLNGNKVAEALFTPSSDTRIELRVVSLDAATLTTSGAGVMKPFAQIEVVAGASAVIGQSVDYVQAGLTAHQPGITAATDVIFNSLVTGNVPLNTGTGVFTLTAGKTYELSAGLSMFSNAGTAVNGQTIYQWVDAGSNTALVTSKGMGTVDVGGTGSAALANSSVVPATLIYTPSTNQTIKLRITGVTLGGSTQFAINYGTNGGSSYAVIKQLGSTAFTGLAMNVLTAAIATGALDNANYTQSWSWSTATSTASTSGLLALSANVMQSGNLLYLDTHLSSTTALALNINGSYAAMFGNNFASTTVQVNDINIGNTTRVRINQAVSSISTITGIAGGVDGREVTLVNASTTSAITIINHNSLLSASSTALNRIITGTGANLTLAADSAITVVYDSTASTTGRWRVVGGSGSGTTNASVTLGDFATGGVVGTAAATVDIANNLNVAQTTTLQTLTLPSPTAAVTGTTTGKTVTVNNTGTAIFTMYGSQIAPLGAGIFIWNGSAWNAIQANGSNVAAENGQVVFTSQSTNLTTAATYFDVSGYTFTLPSAGTYQISSAIRVQGDSTTADVVYQMVDVTVGNVAITGSDTDIIQNANASSVQVTGTKVINYTVTGPTTIKFQLKRGTGTGSVGINSDANGKSLVSWQKISGNAPVSGQSVDYVNVIETLGATVAANGAVLFNVNTGGNIPYNSGTGLFTLTAGKTYRLAGYYQINSNNVGQWQTSAGVALNAAQGANTSGVSSGQELIYTPSVNTDAKYVSISGGTLVSNRSFATIVQIGSSAMTGVAFNSLQAAIAVGALDNANYTQAWSWSTATTTVGLTMNANALTTGGVMNITSNSSTLNSTNGLLYVANTGTSTNGMLASFVASTTSYAGAYISNKGVLSIGTSTVEAWSNQRSVIKIGSGATLIGKNNPIAANDYGYLALGGNYYWDGTNDRAIANATSSRFEMLDGNVRLQYATSTGAGGIASFQNAFAMNGLGLVTIGNVASSTTNRGLTVGGNAGNGNGEVLFTNGTNSTYGSISRFTNRLGVFSSDSVDVVSGTNGVNLANGATSWSAISDARLKSNVLDLNASSSILAKIEGLRPVEYDLANGNHEIGLIAQEVDGILPQLVTKPASSTAECSTSSTEGCYRLNYDRFGIVALQGIKELSGKLSGLSSSVFATSTASSTSNNTVSTSTIAMLARDGTISLESRVQNIAGTVDTLASSTAATSTIATSTDANGNATSTTELTYMGRVMKNITDRLITWFADASNGITKMFVKEVSTDKLCVGQTCVDESELKTLLQKGNVQSSNASSALPPSSALPQGAGGTQTPSSTLPSTPATTNSSSTTSAGANGLGSTSQTGDTVGATNTPPDTGVKPALGQTTGGTDTQ